MLLIPPAVARNFSHTPELMVLNSVLVGSVSALVGLWTAYFLDTPAGPSIVCIAAILFVTSSLIAFIRKVLY